MSDLTNREFLTWVRIINEETDDSAVALEYRKGLASMLGMSIPGPIGEGCEFFLRTAFDRIWRQTTPR